MLDMSQKVPHSQGKVPFSWEKKPGVSKTDSFKDSFETYPTNLGYHQTKQLSLPPSRSDVFRGGYVHDLQLLPLPPCGFLLPRGSASKKGVKKQDDPFFTAYMECTKVPKEVTLKDGSNTYLIDPEYDQTKQLYRPSSRPKIVKGVHIHDATVIPPSSRLPLKTYAANQGLQKQDDPFFTADKECTKIGNKGKWVGGSKDDGFGFVFSCKASCSVRDDTMVFVISKNSNSSKLHKEIGGELHEL